MATETQRILDKLNEIKSELDYIKGHMPDIDAVLTDDDTCALSEAEDDLKQGRTVNL
jgi:hypothetical protein